MKRLAIAVTQSQAFQHFVLGCEAALAAVCLLAWLVPAMRTSMMHGAMSVLWAVAFLQYASRYGLLIKTISQTYQSYRHRVVPPGTECVVLMLAAVTDVVWRVLW